MTPDILALLKRGAIDSLKLYACGSALAQICDSEEEEELHWSKDLFSRMQIKQFRLKCYHWWKQTPLTVTLAEQPWQHFLTWG